MVTVRLSDEEANQLVDLLTDYVIDLRQANNAQDDLGGDIDFLREIIDRIAEQS